MTQSIQVGGGGASPQGWHRIQEFLRCPKAYQYKLRGIGVPSAVTPDYFSVGTMFHAGRAHWFGLNFKMHKKAEAAVFEAMDQAAEQEKLPVSSKALQQARKYISEYISHWGIRPLPTPLAAEHELKATALLPGDPDFWKRTARLDDVSRYEEAMGQLCVGEAKTTSHSVGDCIQQYTLHGQPLLQMALWERAVNGEAMHGPVDGVMLDIIHKGYGRKRSQFGRHFIPVDKRVTEWFIRSLRGYLKAAERVDWNSEVPRNTSGCTFVSSGRRAVCEFRDLCMHGKNVRLKYTVDGKPMRLWEPEPGKTTPPWE